MEHVVRYFIITIGVLYILYKIRNFVIGKGASCSSSCNCGNSYSKKNVLTEDEKKIIKNIKSKYKKN